MLRRIDLHDWKSFHAGALELRPLTVLVGTNASGKSNALEGLQPLAWLATGQRLSELPHAIRTGQVRIRGSVEQLFRRGSQELRLGCQVAAAGEDDPELTFEVALCREPDGALRVAKEKLSAADQSVPLYAAQSAGGSADLTVAYNNFARGGKKPQLVATSAQAVFTQLTTPARFNESHKEAQRRIPRAVERVRSALAGVLFLDPVSARMRGWVPKVEGKKLLPDGSNVSAVLHELLSKPGGAGRRTILEFIGKLPDHDITDLEFLETGRAEVMLKVKEVHPDTGISEEWDAGVVSDGTLRVLAIAAALLSAKPGATVVIEEVDNGVHPSRAEALLAPMLAHAEKRGLSFLDPSRLRARGVGHPPLGEMIAALVHAHLSAGPRIVLPTRAWERSFAGR